MFLDCLGCCPAPKKFRKRRLDAPEIMQAFRIRLKNFASIKIRLLLSSTSHSGHNSHVCSMVGMPSTPSSMFQIILSCGRRALTAGF